LRLHLNRYPDREIFTGARSSPCLMMAHGLRYVPDIPDNSRLSAICEWELGSRCMRLCVLKSMDIRSCRRIIAPRATTCGKSTVNVDIGQSGDLSSAGWLWGTPPPQTPRMRASRIAVAFLALQFYVGGVCRTISALAFVFLHHAQAVVMAAIGHRR
jgi:hypothetical protein